MTPNHIDVHSHLNFPEYDADRDVVLARMKEQGIATITVGTNLETSQSAVTLASQHENIYASIGIHPIDDPAATFDEAAFAALVANPKVVAIGECGLDYFRLEGDEASQAPVKDRQKDIFKQQIEFALKHDKPLMLHCRAAYSDTLDILESYKQIHGEKLRGNSHFFAGTLEEAQRFVKIGFSLSFTGVVTFARNYDEIIQNTPINMLLSETDAPYVAPVPYRGKRNEPTYVREVVAKLAEIKGENPEKMAQILVENAVKIFRIS
jgi:TatD DNase family protein